MYRTFRSFTEIDWESFKDNVYGQIMKEIEGNSDDYLLNVSEMEYVKFLTEKYSYTPLYIDLSSEEVATPREIREDLRRYDDIYTSALYGNYRDGYEITISYSYSGCTDLFHVRPSSFILTSNNISVDDIRHRVSFTIRIYSQNVDEFNREKQSAFHSSFGNVENINSCINSFNASLESYISKKIKAYKQKLLAKNTFFAAIKVKKSTDAPVTYGVPSIKKKQVQKPHLTSEGATQFYPEPCLEMKTYNDIISEVNQIGKSMERKPSLYEGKDEEGLRDVFVAMLETRFEGITATGETFNHCGKTDILLKYAEDGTNLFIAECKFWHGKKHFHAAISQLFDRYLSWRDSKTALIMFVNGANFTKVLDSIKESVPEHPYFLSTVNESKESSFSFIFRLPNDVSKKVYFEVMVFNFDKNTTIKDSDGK